MITLAYSQASPQLAAHEPRTREQAIRDLARKRDQAFVGMYVAAGMGNFPTAQAKRREAFAYQRQIDMLRENL